MNNSTSNRLFSRSLILMIITISTATILGLTVTNSDISDQLTKNFNLNLSTTSISTAAAEEDDNDDDDIAKYNRNADKKHDNDDDDD
jgi:hypothetical protein